MIAEDSGAGKRRNPPRERKCCADELRRHPIRSRRISPRPSAGCGRARRRRPAWSGRARSFPRPAAPSCSTPSWPAATPIWPPAGCSPRGPASTPSGRPATRATRAVAAALRLTDPAMLHYRSGAFYLVRAGQASPPRDGVNDVLLGLVAAAAEPIAGGRHKVFGHRQLNVIPQTSTIASHLPRAVGLAFALPRAAKLGLAAAWPRGRAGGLQLRRRVGQPLHRGRRDQHCGLLQLPGTAAAAAAGLRGQRPGHQRPHPGRLDRGRAVGPGRGAVLLRGRRGPGRRLRRGAGRRGLGAGAAGARVPAYRHGAVRRARGIRCRVGLPGTRRDSRRPAPGSAARDGPAARRASGTATPAEVLARYEASRERVLALAAEVAGAPRLGSARAGHSAAGAAAAGCRRGGGGPRGDAVRARAARSAGGRRTRAR